MAVREIPIPTDVSDLEAIEFQTDLEGRTYGFRFTYNLRLNRWTFDLSDINGNKLLCGIPVYVNHRLLEKYQYNLELPPGILMALNLASPGVSPGREELGRDAILLYEDTE